MICSQVQQKLAVYLRRAMEVADRRARIREETAASGTIGESLRA